jgi:hypothetical protein
MMNKIKTLLLVVMVLAPLVRSIGYSNRYNSAPSADYTLHTLYIFNFVKYIEWPGTLKSIKIGVVNSTQAEEALQKMVKAKSTSAALLSVVNTRDEAVLSECQIIFVPSNSSELASRLIERFSSQPILIVTEEADMTKKGASVSFKVASDKLRFQLNEETIKAKGLKVATALATLAEK